MKIASADVAMGSARVFTELNTTKEKLRAWVGKDQDSAAQSLKDRVVLGANAPLPAPKPTETKGNG